jgi:hypothetical protein
LRPLGSTLLLFLLLLSRGRVVVIVVVARVLLAVALATAVVAILGFDRIRQTQRGQKRDARRSQGTDGIAPNGGSGEDLRGRIG